MLLLLLVFLQYSREIEIKYLTRMFWRVNCEVHTFIEVCSLLFGYTVSFVGISGDN